MKWSIAGLLLLGIVAALSATLLISTLLARANASQRRDFKAKDVTVVVAIRPLDAMSMVKSDDVKLIHISQGQLPEQYLSNTVQVVGKILTRPMVAEQAFTKSCFADDGSGIHVAAALPEGMRAVSIPISSYSGLEGLLYPGCAVDVVASFEPHSGDEWGNQAFSVTLLQNIQILGIEGQTIASEAQESTPDATRSRLRVGNRLMVTLMVDPKQAKTLKLATEFGSISLAMRNPLDASPVDNTVVEMEELTAYRAASFSPVQPALARANPKVRASASGTSSSSLVGSESQPDMSVWETLIYRGRDIETRSFEVDPVQDEQQ